MYEKHFELKNNDEKQKNLSNSLLGEEAQNLLSAVCDNLTQCIPEPCQEYKTCTPEDDRCLKAQKLSHVVCSNKKNKNYKLGQMK